MSYKERNQALVRGPFGQISRYGCTGKPFASERWFIHATARLMKTPLSLAVRGVQEPCIAHRGPINMRSVAAVLAALVLVSGCATLSGPPMLTREDVVRMSKAGGPPQVIIDRLRNTGTVIPLTASDIVQLHQAGVSQEVLDYMQQAQFAEMRRREGMLYGMYPYPYYSPFYGCRWRHGLYPYPGWALDPWGFC